MIFLTINMRIGSNKSYSLCCKVQQVCYLKSSWYFQYTDTFILLLVSSVRILSYLYNMNMTVHMYPYQGWYIVFVRSPGVRKPELGEIWFRTTKFGNKLSIPLVVLKPHYKKQIPQSPWKQPCFYFLCKFSIHMVSVAFLCQWNLGP